MLDKLMGVSLICFTQLRAATLSLLMILVDLGL